MFLFCQFLLIFYFFVSLIANTSLRMLLRGGEIDRHWDSLDGHTVVTDELGSTQATAKATTQQDLPTPSSEVEIWGSQSYSVRRGALCFYTLYGSSQLLSNRVTRTVRGKVESNHGKFSQMIQQFQPLKVVDNSVWKLKHAYFSLS